MRRGGKEGNKVDVELNFEVVELFSSSLPTISTFPNDLSVSSSPPNHFIGFTPTCRIHVD